MLAKFGMMLMTTLLMTQSAFADDPCKHVDTEVDAFSGGERSTAIFQRFGQLRGIGLRMATDGDGAVMTLTTKEGGALEGPIRAGSVFLFLLEDGSVVEFNTVADSVVIPYVSSGILVTKILYILPVSTEQLGQLAGSSVTTVRLPLISRAVDYDWEVSGKASAKLFAASQCFVGRL